MRLIKFLYSCPIYRIVANDESFSPLYL